MSADNAFGFSVRCVPSLGPPHNDSIFFTEAALLGTLRVACSGGGLAQRQMSEVMPQKSTSEILGRVRETLQIATLGLADLKMHPSRRLAGLSNLVVFGRAVTNVLQNLRSTEPSFDTWYKPVQEQLAADPLMKFFYELRTRILKQGDSGVGGYAHIKSFQFPLDMKKFGPPPPNAKNFFIGDSVGGTGWEVEVSPGNMEKYYVDLPSEIGASGLYFRDAPSLTQDSQPTDADVIALSERYMSQLEQVVESAETQFERSGR